MSKTLVVNHDLRFKQKNPSQRQPLSLSTRQTTPRLINLVIKPIRIASKNLFKTRFLKGGNHGIVSKVFAEQRDIIPDARVKNEGLLRTWDDKTRILFGFIPLNRLSIQKNLSCIRLHRIGKQLYQRSLTASRIAFKKILATVL